MAQLIKLQLSGDSTELIQAQVSVIDLKGGSDGGDAAIGLLPSPTTVVSHYQDWRATYLALDTVTRAIVPVSVGEHEGIMGGYASNPIVCQQKAKQFLLTFNNWLRSSGFVSVRDTLTRALKNGGDARLVICTDNAQLQQLPWVLWDFLSYYSDIEVAVSSQTYRAPPSGLTFPAKPGPVQVLAILGDRTNIDIDQDRQFLSVLPNAEVDFLPTPRRSALHDDLWNKPRDVLFFAGHSRSEGSSGAIQINADEELSLEDIQHALGRVAKHGLTLAIFNSCDGLGLAKYLSQAIAPTTIPYIIVMRELVPDAVAQTFLKYFLEAFSRGEAFHASVRTARERLENSSEDLPPYGEWMPVIWQNPLAEPPMWPQPVKQKKRRPLAMALAASAMVAAGVIGLRFAGALQGLELNAYDGFVRSRPPNMLVDPNILVVNITESEINQDKDRDGLASISNANLEKLLDRLYEAEPSVVGLDIIRDAAIGSEYSDLKKHFTDGDLITVCVVGDSDAASGNAEVAPPPDAELNSISFANISKDRDGVLRRHLLGMDVPPGKCHSNYAFSTMLAYNYLEKENAGVLIDLSTTNKGFWKWGSILPFLGLHQGGYNVVEDMRGATILTNYRMLRPDDKSPFATVTLNQVLNGEVSANLIKDHIILIGSNAISISDRVTTPLRTAQGNQLEIPGVVYQAHLVSQLVDIAEGRRPMLRPSPLLFDCAWILLWAGVGSGIVAVYCSLSSVRSPRSLYVLIGGSSVAIITLYGACWLVLVHMGLWLPLVPAIIALAGGAGACSTLQKISNRM